MKKTKKGISLIVLVITIIIMIILAAAVVITLSNSNIINRADEAVSKTSLSQVQELASIAWTEAYAEGKRAGKVLNATELHDAVIKSLKENGLKDKDLENYTILTTEKGVTVTLAVPTLVIDQKLGTSAVGAEVIDSSPFTLSGTVTDNKGVKSLTVNGVEVTVGNDGKWSTTLTIEDGETKEIIVVATNEKNVSTTIKGYVTRRSYVDVEVATYNLSKLNCAIDENGVLNIPATYYNESEGVWYRVTSIGSGGFAGAELTSVIIPESVTSIGMYAFIGCTSLTSITIPSSVTTIGSGAFSYTQLTSVTIPEGVTSISGELFADCPSLTSITIPEGVTSIGESAFKGTGITTVTIPGSVISIGEKAFQNCTGLTSVTIPEGVTSVGQEAFQNCTNLTNVTIPSSVTTIGNYAFSGCTGLTNITIPVTTIGSFAFYGCTGLTNITIPKSVTDIGIYAFYRCEKLTSVVFENTSGWVYGGENAVWQYYSISTADASTNATNLTDTYYNYDWSYTGTTE